MSAEAIKNTKLHFILSTERTGSTLLSTMLNMHPNILSTFEEPFAFTLYPKYKNVKNWTSETIKQYCYDFYLFSEGYLEIQFGTKENFIALLEKHKTELTCDLAFKLSYYNFFPGKDKSKINTIVDKQLIYHTFLEEAARIYPQSKFIILHRDPRDNALVRMRKSQKQKRSIPYWYFAFSWNYVYTSFYKKKKRIGEERFMEVKYEDLVSDPESELKKICVFLDLVYDDCMLAYDELMKKEMPKRLEKVSELTQEHVELLHGGLKQKPSTEKIGIWKTGLKEKEIDLIWSVCGNIATAIGYKKAGIEKPVKKDLSYYRAYYDYWKYDILLPRLYYSLPFFIRYWIKKKKYGNYRGKKVTSEAYYRSVMHD